MIFVTVGMHTVYGFDRLIKKMDYIARKIDDHVIMQIGCANYEPKNAEYFRFMPKNEMDELYKSARVVVCHAGIGSILTALEYVKPVIAVPRRKKYGEHIDDHQLEISGEMENEGRITVVCDVEELEDVLTNVSTDSVVKVEKDNRLVGALKEYLEGLDAKD